MRLGHAFLSMFAVTLLVFGMVRVTGDPVYFLLPSDSLPEDYVRATKELGLDQPLLVQFFSYFANAARGDLGMSFWSMTPVTDHLVARIPATLMMAAAALVLTLVVSVPLGIASAYWRGGVVDRGARFFAAIGQSMPNFWVGIILILVFAITFRVLPSGGYGGIQHVILPAATLAIGAIAALTRLLRSSMIEVLEADYVAFHRIKGLPERRVLFKHALRNSAVASLSYVGIVTAGFLTGSVLVETVFVWPGVGRLMVEAIANRDFTLVQGCMLLFASVYIVVNLIVDLLYTVLNPRLR